MKTLKIFALGILIGGTIAACSSRRTGTGAGPGTTGTDTSSGGIYQNGQRPDTGDTGTTDTVSMPDKPDTSRTDAGSGAGGVSGVSETGMGSTSGQMSSTYSTPSQFLNMASQSGTKEVELSQLALTRATDPAVRDFAQKMVSQHTQRNQQLMSVARSKNISLSGAMTGMGAGPETTVRQGEGVISGNEGINTRTDTLATESVATDVHMNASMSPDISSLQNLSGSAFDRRYMEIMINDHEQAVNLFTSASQAKDSQISKFARKTLPALRAHLYDAKQIHSRLR